VVEGGKLKGLIIVTGFANSQKLAWMDNLIMALDQNLTLSPKSSR
jgi:hypothetical protein